MNKEEAWERQAKDLPEAEWKYFVKAWYRTGWDDALENIDTRQEPKALTAEIGKWVVEGQATHAKQLETIRTLTAQLSRKDQEISEAWNNAEINGTAVLRLTTQLAEAVEAVRQINYQAVNCMSINSLRKHIKGISRSVLEANHD